MREVCRRSGRRAERPVGSREIGCTARLAQVRPASDVPGESAWASGRCRVPDAALSISAQIMEEGYGRNCLRADPGVRRIILDLAPPGMEDQAPDRERLERALLKAGVVRPVFGLPVLRDLAQTLRDSSFKCAVTLIGDEVVDVRSQPGGGLLGMAFDIGTTTVVGYLIDLTSGRELAVASALNPQVRHGSDVISRIVYGIEEPDGVETLSRLIGGTDWPPYRRGVHPRQG